MLGPRPPLQARQSAATLVSTASCPSSERSSDPSSTALTSPDLLSPRSGGHHGRLQGILDVYEGKEELYPSRRVKSGQTPDMQSRGNGLGRGTSVKDRANMYEQSQSTEAGSSKQRVPSQRYQSTSPYHQQTRGSSSVTPTNVRRVPVPATEPSHRAGYLKLQGDDESPTRKRTAAPLARGPSAKKMIQQWEHQWENRPSEFPPAQPRYPSSAPRMTSRQMSREYLDTKPLPLPTATPISPSTPTRPSPSRQPPYAISPSRMTGSPARAMVPSPLHQQHLQTPVNNTRQRANTLTPSPSAYSITPSMSGEKRRKGGKSPLKGMLSAVGDGLKEIGRKAKGKNKDVFTARPSPIRAMSHDTWENSASRYGSNGLPGGIVFSDRMGDQEMDGQGADDPNVIRTSPVVYLMPTPCSSVAQWGSWFTSYATLTPSALKITYCPVFQQAHSGHSTPKRVLSGMIPSTPTIPFASIPPPSATTGPDVELAMKDCVEVRSLRKDEWKGRGIPSAPEGIGTEVLEMVWSDGSKRYLGVEGVGGRLGWVSAIWDVLLACKSTQPPVLPPPSPVPMLNHHQQSNQYNQPNPYAQQSTQYNQPKRFSAQDHTPLPSLNQTVVSADETPLFPSRLTLEPSSAPPAVQKVGDTWVAASVLGSSDVGPLEKRESADALRDSVQRMFDTGPDVTLALGGPAPTRRESETKEAWRCMSEGPGKTSTVAEKIKAWQPSSVEHDSHEPWLPSTERDLSIFSRPTPRDPEVSSKVDDMYLDEPVRQSETLLSFDPNDLNPSRSASQVRRAPTVIEQKRFLRTLTPVMDEGESSLMDEKPPTQISHITFPKPTMGGLRVLPTIPSGRVAPMDGESTTESVTNTENTHDSNLLQTPQTSYESSATSHSDPTLLARLDSHSTEHGTMTKQIDGISATLATLVATSKTPSVLSPDLDERLGTMHQDVKAIENALNLSSLAGRGLPSLNEPKLPEIHAKLDAIANLCETFLGKGEGAKSLAAPGSATTPIKPTAKAPQKAETAEEKEAGEEVAFIMADLVSSPRHSADEQTGGSNKGTSPRIGGIQVLHDSSKSKPDAPKGDTKDATAAPKLSDDATKQVSDILSTVKELKEARALQTQQTTDIARYLNELNTWLEKFVANSTSELSAIGKGLTSLTGTEATEEKPGVPGIPELVADVHKIVAEQKRQREQEGPVGARLDGLLKMMGDEKERHAGQHTMVEQIYSTLDKQRHDNELLLRALAADLTSEIRGERMRFVESMQQATSLNIHMHVEEFKKLLSAEVNKSMGELGSLREQKKALEHQIADLFALKAKHGAGSRKASAAAPPKPAPAPAAAPAAAPPGGGGRGLPNPPPGRR